MNWSVSGSPLVLSARGDHQSLVSCVVFCSPLLILVVFVLFPLAIILFVLSLMASDYLYVIFKLFLAEKSTTETRGTKVITRVCFVFVCGCSFFIQCWWMLFSLFSSFKSLNVICKWFCLDVTVPMIIGVEIGPKFNLSKKSPFFSAFFI